jgi:hypothetical protein
MQNNCRERVNGIGGDQRQRYRRVQRVLSDVLDIVDVRMKMILLKVLSLSPVMLLIHGEHQDLVGAWRIFYI